MLRSEYAFASPQIQGPSSNIETLVIADPNHDAKGVRIALYERLELSLIPSKMGERLDARVPTYDGGNEYTMIVAGRFVTESRQMALLWKAAFAHRMTMPNKIKARAISKIGQSAETVVIRNDGG